MTAIQIAILLSASIAMACAVWLLFREKRIIPLVTFSAGLIIFSLELIVGWLAIDTPSPDDVVKLYGIRQVILSLAPSVWLAFAVTWSRGDYATFLKRWFPAILGLAIVGPATALILHSNLVHLDGGALRLGLAGRIVHISVVLGSTAVLMNIERTFRASVGVMRWQMKFITIGLATLFLTRIYTSTQSLVFSAIDPSLDTYNAAALAICCVFSSLSVTRSKRFMLDLYPSATLIHRSLTVIVVGIYLLGVGLLANAVAKLGGNRSFPAHALLLLVALVLLGAVLFSDRVRLETKRFVGRHLRRPVYDVRKIWREFNERTAGLASESDLCRVSARWLSETFETLSVSLWLVGRDGSSIAFGASTCMTEDAAADLVSQVDIKPALAEFQRQQQPVNLDETKNDSISRLRAIHPAQFLNGGDRTCVPIFSGNEMLALLMLGDRVAGISFSIEEMDLIKCIGNQIGGDILRLRLSEKLGEAKEIQAFQTMATFFVHDLKNTVWSLSLLVDNLGRHFDDPAFRAEAIKALSTSVKRMNDLIARIGSLRESLKLNRESADINALVSKVLKEFTDVPGLGIESELANVPPISVDVSHLQSVVRNLVLNAREAMTNGHGKIQVTTEKDDGYAVITVRDNGCGMSDEFLRKKLFRPFQTTKNKGIGIGMFQSKMIIEAHEGRMLVESKQGSGTTIRVLLPLIGEAHEA